MYLSSPIFGRVVGLGTCELYFIPVYIIVDENGDATARKRSGIDVYAHLTEEEQTIFGPSSYTEAWIPIISHSIAVLGEGRYQADRHVEVILELPHDYVSPEQKLAAAVELA